MKFNDFYWHDAIIKNIQIDRNNPGNDDSILFEVEWPEDNERGLLVFEDVYWTSMNLNFGIIADESILDVTQLDKKNEDLVNFYSKWKGVMNEVQLNTYKIELNSTGGEIKIIAKSFRIDK
ncbi:hypothetical protein [Flavobacterium sp. HSC-61S13]|uniref:hypothetical protein n=1 Tax=Flavobacterium sp. HSC-61S13 TaxID=2910963 RepID=UPI00209C83F5|nr:hypothetical protein [Flavobacterium sp. HSC-61S13]MCP1995052.1 hypothetical protein [Flavobacterium sp. HSC-61S13]